jgi:hypothetical protein
MKRDALLPYERLHTGGEGIAQPPTACVSLTVERYLPPSKSASVCCDYSEEAIPERDPTFRLPGGTDYEGPTVEAVSAAGRLILARRLEQLGMSRTRAAAVVSLC